MLVGGETGVPAPRESCCALISSIIQPIHAHSCPPPPLSPLHFHRLRAKASTLKAEHEEIRSKVTDTQQSIDDLEEKIQRLKVDPAFYDLRPLIQESKALKHQCKFLRNDERDSRIEMRKVKQEADRLERAEEKERKEEKQRQKQLHKHMLKQKEKEKREQKFKLKQQKQQSQRPLNWFERSRASLEEHACLLLCCTCTSDDASLTFHPAPYHSTPTPSTKSQSSDLISLLQENQDLCSSLFELRTRAMLSLDSEYIPSSRAVGVLPSSMSGSSSGSGSNLSSATADLLSMASGAKDKGGASTEQKSSGTPSFPKNGLGYACKTFEKAYADGFEQAMADTIQWPRGAGAGASFYRTSIFAEAALDYQFTKAVGLGVQALYVEAGFLGPACERGENEFVAEVCERYYKVGGLVGFLERQLKRERGRPSSPRPPPHPTPLHHSAKRTLGRSCPRSRIPGSRTKRDTLRRERSST